MKAISGQLSAISFIGRNLPSKLTAESCKLMASTHSPPTACKHAVSGTISLPSQGFFSPFPHGTGSLSVEDEYLALPDGPGGFLQGSTCPAVLRSHWKEDCIFTYGAVTLSGRPFQTVPLMLFRPSFAKAVSAQLPGSQLFG